MDLDKTDIEQILALVDGAPFDVIHIEWKGLKLTLKRDHDGKFGANEINTSKFPAKKTSDTLSERQKQQKTEKSFQKAALEPPNKDTPTEEKLASDQLLPVKAPTVGTLYRRPEPDAPPFVELGAKVSEGDTLCLIEVMKVFTAITTSKSGIVRKILAEVYSMIEHYQTLFLIEPENVEKKNH